METMKARRMATELMRQHLDSTWTLRFDNAKNRFGRCSYGKREISLSTPLVRLNDEDRVRQTVLHEIAHALAGPGAGHGYAWAAKCRELGIRPDRCFTAENTVIPDGNYKGTCPTCGFVVTRHRVSKAMKGGACPKCCAGTYDPQHIFTWTKAGRPFLP